jgi:acylphosphatase
VVAEGRRGELEQLLAALERGPYGADVGGVEAAWSAAQGTFSGFLIRH